MPPQVVRFPLFRQHCGATGWYVPETVETIYLILAGCPPYSRRTAHSNPSKAVFTSNARDPTARDPAQILS